MPVLITADVPDQTPEGYDTMLSMLEAGLRHAPGFVLHSSHPIDGGWRVIEIWESSRQATDFFAKHVHPNLPPGINPKRSLNELHSLVK